MRVELEKVTKKYGKLVALKNVSFTLLKGEIVGLLGPNGAGKSTLMKILTGYYINWEGKISFEGLNLKEKRSAIPVSYTHLTLPTICSV